MVMNSISVNENSHRADDEYFHMIHAERCTNKDMFLYKTQMCQDIWNFYRPSSGKAMYEMTPYEKFTKADTLINPTVFKFPVFLMEDLFTKVGIFTRFILPPKGGKYVYTKRRIKAEQFLETSFARRYN